MARVEVVPWSIARTCVAATMSPHQFDRSTTRPYPMRQPNTASRRGTDEHGGRDGPALAHGGGAGQRALLGRAGPDRHPAADRDVRLLRRQLPGLGRGAAVEAHLR